jgi:hypothetical protein
LGRQAQAAPRLHRARRDHGGDGPEFAAGHSAIREILGAIRQLTTPPEPPRKRGIGFIPTD